VLHDVAASQVCEAGVPKGARFPRFQGRNPPAHRIAAGVLPPTAIVVAHLELRGFAALSRIHARRHVAIRRRSVGHAHHETHAPRMTSENSLAYTGLPS